MDKYNKPRPFFIQKASTHSRPLIIAGGGFTNKIEDNDEVSWFEKRFGWQINSNFVRSSGLREWARSRDVNLCFISSSRFQNGPGWLRNWMNNDLPDVRRIREIAGVECSPSKIYLYGFSDFVEFVHILAAEPGFCSGAVCHSGFFPKDKLNPQQVSSINIPILLVCGKNDPHKSIREQTGKTQVRYTQAGRKCDLLWVYGLGHDWAVNYNDYFFDYLEKYG